MIYNISFSLDGYKTHHGKPFSFMVIVFLLVSTAVLSGCLDQDPERADDHLFSLTSEHVNESNNDSKKWIYQQSMGSNATFFLQDGDLGFFLKQYEKLLFYLTVTDLSVTNTSFKMAHEVQLPLILEEVAMDTNASSVSLDSLLSLSMSLEILLKSPYAEQYQNESSLIQRYLIDSYPYEPESQSGNDLIVYHLTMAHISTSLLLHAYLSQNTTSYEHALFLLENATLLDDYLGENVTALLCSSLYSSPCTMVSLLFDETTFDQYVFSTASHLLSYVGTNEDDIGSFLDLTTVLDTVPTSFAENVFIGAITDAYKIRMIKENDTNKTDDLFKALILTGYHIMQQQITSQSDPLFVGGFPLSNGSDTPSILSSVQSYRTIQTLDMLLEDQQPYIYVYNERTGEIYESHPYDVHVTDSIWPALIIGTVFSVVLIVGVFLIIRFKKWQ